MRPSRLHPRPLLPLLPGADRNRGRRIRRLGQHRRDRHHRRRRRCCIQVPLRPRVAETYLRRTTSACDMMMSICVVNTFFLPLPQLLRSRFFV